MTIQHYLETLSGKLKLSPRESLEVLKEVEGHLMQDAAALERSGCSRADAETQACKEFGEPKDVAEQYRSMSSWFFRAALRVVALTILMLLVVENIPDLLFLGGTPSYALFQWYPVMILSSYTLFGVVMFLVVQHLTFSKHRLRKLLIITLATVYVGGILYPLMNIAISMTFATASDSKMVFGLLITQAVKLIPMILVYALMYRRLVRTSTRVVA